jgi:CoA:oxalate CoA-transferase
VECTGVGQHIDLGMLEAMLATDDYVHYSLEDRLPVWPATGRIYNVVGGPLMIAGDAKVLWSRLTKFGALSDPDPNAALDAKLKTRVELIAQWVDSFPTRKQLIRSLEMAGLAWADVRTPDSVMQSPTVIARNISAQVDDREGGTRPVIRMPYRFSAAKSEPRGGAALVGEHNDEVMREWLGLGVDEVVELIASGALRITPGM